LKLAQIFDGTLHGRLDFRGFIAAASLKQQRAGAVVQLHVVISAASLPRPH